MGRKQRFMGDVLRCVLVALVVVGIGCGGGASKDVADAARASDAAQSADADAGVVTTDTTAPTIASLNPASGLVNPTPTRVVVVFSESVNALTSSHFVISGTCTELPSKGAVVMSAGDTTATLTLSGGTCTLGQTLSVAVDPASVSDRAGNAGVGAIATNTYIVNTLGPSASLGTPSSVLMNVSGSSTVALMLGGSVTGSTALSGTLTESGGGVTVTTLTGDPACTVGVSGITTMGATITVSGCTGNGTLTVHVDAGVAVDALDNASTVSPESAIITVDNDAPRVVSVSPASSVVSATPSSVVAVFSESMSALSASQFTIGGTCSALPSKGSVVMSARGTIATLALSGGTCTGGQTVTVAVDPMTTSDVAGNAGAGSVATSTYTMAATGGPNAALGTPSSTLLNAADTATIALMLTPSSAGGTALTGALTSVGGGVTVTTLTGDPLCTVGASFISPLGAAITLSNCQGNGTLTLHVDAGVAVDAESNPSTASSESAVITIDNDAPTLTVLTPVSARVNPLPSSVSVVFDEAMGALSASRFTLGGTCTALPSKGSVVMSSGDTTATLSLSGGVCTNGQTFTVSVDPTGVTDAAGNVGAGMIVTNTYTMTTLGPTTSVGAPSSTLLNAASTSTLALTFNDSEAGGIALSGSLTAVGGGVTVTTLTGDASCSVGVASITTSGASVTLSNCVGDGTVSVHANAGVMVDALSNPSVVSGESATITVDNTGPTITSLTPASARVNPTPSSIVVVFNEPVNALSASQFTLGGTCSALPTKGSVTMSSGSTIATLALSAGTCTNAQTLTVAVDPAAANDLAGNAGTGSIVTNTYTVSTVGPSVSFDSVSTTLARSAGQVDLVARITASMAGGTSLSGTLTTAGGGVTVTTLSGNPSCTVSVSGISTTGATIALSACTGNGTLSVHVDAGVAADALSNASSVSSESATITIDNTGPTITALTPATGAVKPLPSSVTVTFSEAVADLSASQFSLSGTCTTLPTKGSVVMSAGNTVATLALSGGTCSNQQTVIVSVDPTAVLDVVGNAGTGSATTRTYYYISTGPTITLSTPSATTISSSQTSSITMTIVPTYAGGTTLTGSLTSSGGAVGLTRICGTPSCTIAVDPLTSGSSIITLSNCTGNGTFTLHVDAGVATDALGNTSVASAESATITIANSCSGSSGYDFGGTTVTSMTTADVNNDCLDDLIIGTSTLVSVLPACASNTFGSATTYTLAAGSGYVAARDVSGDSRPDILAVGTSSGTASASVLINSGTGTFGSATAYTLPDPTPLAAQLGDFDGDGDQDIAALSSSTSESSISILFNAGTGTFGTAHNTTVPRTTSSTSSTYNCVAAVVVPGTTSGGGAVDRLVVSCPSYYVSDDVEAASVDSRLIALDVGSDGSISVASYKTFAIASLPMIGSSVAYASGTTSSVFIGNPAASNVAAFPISSSGVLGTQISSPNSSAVFSGQVLATPNMVLWNNGPISASIKGFRAVVRDTTTGSLSGVGGIGTSVGSSLTGLQSCVAVERSSTTAVVYCVQGITPKVRVYTATKSVGVWTFTLLS